MKTLLDHAIEITEAHWNKTEKDKAEAEAMVKQLIKDTHDAIQETAKRFGWADNG